MIPRPIPTVLAVFVAALLPGPAFSVGVAVTKEQSFHDDDSAKPFVFDSVVDSGNVLTFTRGTERFNIERTTFVRYVEVPSAIPKEITTPEQVAAIRKKTTEIEEFAGRYAKTKPILEGHLGALKETLAKLDSEQVRVRGEWIPRKKYEADRAEANARAKAKADKLHVELERRKAERQAFEAEQRAKGLVEYRGDWLKPDEAAKRREEDQLNARMSDLLKERSVTDAVISIFQSLDDGALCNILSGKSETTRTKLCFVRDVTMTADNELYKGTLYYAGTYSYINQLNTRRTVAAYCVGKKNAVAYLRGTLGGGASDVAENSRPSPRSGSGSRSGSSLPEELQFASGFGSGFFVGKEGYIVTNHHVVKDATKVCVYHHNQLLSAEIITVSGVSDLAILKVEARTPGLSLSPEEQDSGNEIYALGFPVPQLQGTELKVTRGIISSSTGIQNDALSYQIDAAVQPGNSGGPICTSKGVVAGVVVAKLNDAVARQTGSLPENVNYAIKSTEVLALLRSKGITGADLESDVSDLQSAKRAVCLIAVR